MENVSNSYVNLKEIVCPKCLLLLTVEVVPQIKILAEYFSHPKKPKDYKEGCQFFIWVDQFKNLNLEQ